ncbi:DUF3667 domain-containing protein [Henriciella sp. AS95]|uniref:DUF3667 domain-containing protein n=1 Tax=Henriciella sp. AS95 TaxID=3135782 RepID=UPI0031757DE9
MSSEMETLGTASLGSLGTSKRADLSGQPCRNCGEMVDQRHCPRCGQLAASFHRPFLSLIFETVSDSLALDGRIARTLPLLMFRPGVLTRRYNEGKRARYVPPFRLFLLSSLIFYFVVFALLDGQTWTKQPLVLDGGDVMTEQEAAELQQELKDAGVETGPSWMRFGTGDDPSMSDEAGDEETPTTSDGDANTDTTGEADADAETGTPADSDFESEIEERIRRIADNPRLFFMALQDWAPRLSLMLVPLTMLTLALMYFWKRKLYTYNHAIHAFHLHTWMYLAGTVAVVLSLATGPGVWGVFLLVVPIYVLLSLRGAYGTGFFMGFLRTALLGFVWLIGLSVLTAFTFLASVFSV